MKKWNKNKKFFVGVDSDGTVFDSMTVKHKEAFIPAMIEEWKLDNYKEDLYDTAERINLYSSERGINRFPGLVRTFEDMEKLCGEDFPIHDYKALKDFVNSGLPMSNSGLEKYISKHPSAFLEQVLHWSKHADDMFSHAAEKLMPFMHVDDVLKELHKSADIMVVSAASYSGLFKDWTRAGLTKHTDGIAGQEFGSKSDQLAYALKSGYCKENCLMIGDGIGDMTAAKDNGILFYPIIPLREEESWKRLKNEYLAHFLEGNYSGEIENSLCKEFIMSLDN